MNKNEKTHKVRFEVYSSLTGRPVFLRAVYMADQHFLKEFGSDLFIPAGMDTEAGKVQQLQGGL